MTRLADVFDQEGTRLHPSGGGPLLLTDRNRVMLVESGEVELFMAQVEGGKVVGGRHHVASVTSGRVVFGITPGVERLGLLGVGRPETTLREMPVARLRERARDIAVRHELARAVEEWIDDLSAALPVEAPPKRHHVLEPGSPIRLPKGTLARGGRRVLWVAPREGSVQLVGRSEYAVESENRAVPVTGATWIAVTEDSVLDVRDTDAALQSGALWRDMETFHATVFRAVSDRVARALETERDRLRRRAESDRDAMAAALAQLSSVTELRRPTVTAVPADVSPLLAACRLVAAEQGITLREPRADPGGVHARDPLQALARASRIHLRRVALRDDWWRRDNGPLLAFVEDGGRPVAILPDSDDRYEQVDPTMATRTAVTPAAAESLSSFGYVFYRALPDRAMTALGVLKFGLEACPIRDMVTVLGLGVAGGLVALLAPIATGIVFDSIIPSAERGQLMQLATALAVMALAGGLFRLTQGLAMLRIEGKMSASMQAGIWDRLLKLPAPFFRRFLVGDLARRSLGIDAIRRALTGATLASLLSGVFSVFSLALLFYYSGTLALVALGVTLLAVVATSLASIWTLKYERVLQEVSGKIDGLVVQLINGMAKLRLAGAEVRAFALWAREFTTQRGVAFRARTVGNALETFNAAFGVVALMIVFAALVVVTSRAVASGGTPLSTGSFLAFNAAFGQFLAAALSLSSVLVSILLIIPLYERAKPILESLPEVDEDKMDPGELRGDIDVSHVSFRYHEDGPLVLDDVSLKVKPGEFVAIVGPSGAGKSSLLRLLLGFEKPEAGSVYYDGQDLGALDLQAVRRQTGVVLQNAQVLPGSFFENIVGSAPLTLEDANEAARMAGLDQDIAQMPMGMHTFIAEGGKTLSGGQRQRLLIARAVVGHPRILLFDEATSAVDNRTQQQISRSLEQLHATRIVIAHRLSTVVNADRIYVMDAGRVVQVGTYAELVAEEGPFAALAARQIA